MKWLIILLSVVGRLAQTQTRTFDWIGYQFPTQHTFSSVSFQEGMHFSDGGWFTSLGVQVRVGGQWVDVQNLQSIPPYAGGNGISYETYELSFTPMTGDGIRIAGVPGGSATYISVGELRVFESIVLPIQLVSFTVSVISPTRVRLDWSTLTELNNYGFEVQKSDTTQQHYQSIPNVFILGHGTTNEPRHYSFIDSSATVGAWYYRLKQMDLDGAIHYYDGVRVNLPTSVKEQEIPTVFSLAQNYPNPWNPSTTIRYGVPHNSFVTLTVYNTLGQQVVQLVNEQQQAGYHNVVLRGDGLASGVYFYRLQAGNFVVNKKLLLLK